MVVQLMKYGADPSLIDGEGCSCGHLAAQFGHTSIVAYLIAKGQVGNVNAAAHSSGSWRIARILKMGHFPAAAILVEGVECSPVEGALVLVFSNAH